MNMKTTPFTFFMISSPHKIVSLSILLATDRKLHISMVQKITINTTPFSERQAISGIFIASYLPTN